MFDVMAKIQDEEIRKKIILDFYNDYKTEFDRINSNYNKYKITPNALPIQLKTLTEEEEELNKPCNRLIHAFRNEIVDQKVNLSFTNPIKYVYNDKKQNDVLNERANLELNYIVNENNFAYKDYKLAIKLLASGQAARLCFINKEAKLKIINIYDKVIAVKDEINEKVILAFRFYDYKIENDKGEMQHYIKIEMYDEAFIYYYLMDFGDNKVNIIEDFTVENYKVRHLFNYVPLVVYELPQRNPIYHEVETLIDGYDKLVSLNQDELEYFRNAYLLLIGGYISQKEFKSLMKLGGINLPEQGMDARYLTKNINKDFVEMQLKTLESKIYNFSKTVNYQDESFSGGTVSGDSRRWKMLNFLSDGARLQKEFENNSYQLFLIIANYITNFKNIKIEAGNFELQFTNYIPADLHAESEVTQNLKGLVSEETRLKLLSFVKDVNEEKRKMEEDLKQSLADEYFVNDNNDEINE